MYLVPPGSFPVGWDVWWNLHVARLWAESGVPSAIPAAGFTQFAHDYADRQLLFHGILAAVGGSGLGPGHVPWILYALALLLVAVVWRCARSLVDRVPVAGLLLLWGLSATALFRATALRDMLLAVLPLLILVTTLTRCSIRPIRQLLSSGDGIWIFVTAALFTLSHGAPVLPLVLALLVCVGRRIETRSFGFSTLIPLVCGIVLALVARPNPSGALELFWTLNVEMPLAALSGALPIQPSEFAALPIASLFRLNWPLFVAALFIAAAAYRRQLDPRLAIPALALVVGSCFGARLLELAAPFVVLALLASRGAWSLGRWPGLVFVVAVGLAPLAVSKARPSIEANRFVALEGVARFLVEHAEPRDVVFVTDWGVSSPLAFLTREKPLVFTGVTDPILMLHEDPARFRAWWRIKSAADDAPVQSMRSQFGARFAVIGFADRAPGRPVGETSLAIWKSLGEAERRGLRIRSADFPSPPGRRAVEPGFRVYEFLR